MWMSYLSLFSLGFYFSFDFFDINVSVNGRFQFLLSIVAMYQRDSPFVLPPVLLETFFILGDHFYVLWKYI